MINKTKYITILMWPIVTILFYGALRDLLTSKVASPLWEYVGMAEGAWLNVSVSLAIACCLVWGWKSKKKAYDSHHIGIFLSIIALILLFYHDYTPNHFLSYFNFISCWGAIVYSYLLGFVSHYLYDKIKPLFKTKKDETFPKVYLFQDKPECELDNDGLAYSGFAKRIASAIINNTWKESFSIGITGTWGAGKSSMLHFVKEYLRERDDIIVIEFTPRQSVTVQDIQKDFLIQLSESLSKYHSGAQRVTQKYMQSLGTLPDSLWAARVLGSIADVEITQRRNKLIEVVNEIGKKIVVLVDDFDRLSGEEIQEVLKLIDKNAAFPKTFFVTAYDKIQTNQVISKYLGHESGDDKVDYTDKYFNLEVSLPHRRNSNYIRVLRQNLYALADAGIITSTRADIDAALPKVYPFISKCLSTIRDAKRYCNLVSITLPPLEANVMLGDFLLVTLIRYKYPEEYYKLGRFSYIVKDGSKKKKKKFYELNSADFSGVKSKDILKALFNGKNAPFKSVAHLNSFAYYFYDIDSGHLLYEDLVDLLKPEISPKDFKIKVNQIVKSESQKSDFVEFVLSYEHNIQKLEDAIWYLRFFLMARTYCNSNDLYIATLSYLLKDNVQANMKQFCIDSEKDYIGLLKDVLNDRFEYWISIESLHDALHAVTSLDTGESVQLIFSFDELNSFAIKKVEKAISEIPTGNVTPDVVYRAMKACVIEYIKNGPGETVAVEAIVLVKKAMGQYPNFFFKDFLSHRKNPNKSSAIQFYIDDSVPYKDLFKGIEDFASFITEISKEGDSSALLCLSQFADYGCAQKTWTPSLPIQGDFSTIKQHDYKMYNQLFEGEPTYA